MPSIDKPLIPFPNRPWVRGTLRETLSRDTILHVDAHIGQRDITSNSALLTVSYRKGGLVSVALDLYLIDIQAGTLTPVWAIETSGDWPGVTWNGHNAPWMARVHASVLRLALAARQLSGVTRTSVHCHYIDARDASPWPRSWVNDWKPPRDRNARGVSLDPRSWVNDWKPPRLPDIL